MSKQDFMTSLIFTGGVISIKMLSLFICGHKKDEAPKAATAFRALFFADIRL
jgi:hypothetical protein